MKRGVAKDLPFGASVLETSLLAPTSQHLLLQFLINTHLLVLRVPRKAWAVRENGLCGEGDGRRESPGAQEAARSLGES